MVRRRGRSGMMGFLDEMVEYYFNIQDMDYMPIPDEIKEKLDDTADKHGIELFREGTNRSIYKEGGYVYKLCHKYLAVEDNIREHENTLYAEEERADDVIDRLALSDNFYRGCEYILEQEYITPLHELEEIVPESGQPEAEAILTWLVETASDEYGELISIMEDYFVIADVSPKSVFNFGVKTDRNNTNRLAILDYGYFVPKRGELLCPECRDGILKYSLISLRNGNNLNQIIKDVKSTQTDNYVCTNSSCYHYETGIPSPEVVKMFEAGEIETVESRDMGDRRSQRAPKSSRSRGRRTSRRTGGRLEQREDRSGFYK